jgi:hypothetical protein
MSFWFKKVFGCREDESNRHSKIKLKKQTYYGNDNYTIEASGKKYLAGYFDLYTLKEIRELALEKFKELQDIPVEDWGFPNDLYVENIEYINILDLHSYKNKNSVFQVASQFNCLEFVDSNEIPENGITNYINDKTQGPACCLACPIGTYYRNYHCLNGDQPQTENDQINTLYKLSKELGNSNEEYFTIENGYLTLNGDQSKALGKKLKSSRFNTYENIEKHILDNIQIGVQEDTEVVGKGNFNNYQVLKYEKDLKNKIVVSQVFCSTLSFNGYNKHNTTNDTLAKYILQAQYEATLWYTFLNAFYTKNNQVYLTLVGGGVFDNEYTWIYEAIERAIKIMKDNKIPLEIFIVHHKKVSDNDSIFWDLQDLTIPDYNNSKSKSKNKKKITKKKLKKKLAKTEERLAILSKKMVRHLHDKTYPDDFRESIDTCNKGLKHIIKKI